jgi:large subunit ribosomal protein L33
MARKGTRITIHLACTECGRRNYTTEKNRRNDSSRIEMMKYCKWDREHTLHRETK